MKIKLKKIIPDCLIKYYRRVIVLRRFILFKDLLMKNYGLKSSNDTVVILGNGPSIKQLDLPSLLEKEDVIVMNSFFHHPDACKLNIVAYCLGEQGVDAAYYDFSKVFEVKSSQYWFSSDFSARIQPLPNNVYIYFPGDDAVLSKENSQIDLSMPGPYYETTAQMAIIIALFLGYKKIILLGYDHDFLASGKYLSHFYDEDFNDEVSISRLYINGSDYHALIKNCDQMWSRYKKIDSYARSRGVKIINCGINSYLDVFSRGQLKDTLKKIKNN